MIIELHNRVISKKNSKHIIKRGNKKFLVPSDAYEIFRTKALNEIDRQFNWHIDTIVSNVHIDYTFKLKGKMFTDVDNMICSVNDILQDAHILKNDSQVISGKFIIIRGADDWYTRVDITQGFLGIEKTPDSVSL